MADTTFTDQVTVVVAAWLNDVNARVYQDQINAKNAPFSLVGNGTTDDSVGLQAAITAAAAAEVPLYVPAGTYRITTQLSLPSNLIWLSDPNTIYFFDTGATYASSTWMISDGYLSETANENIYISGGKFQGATAWASQGSVLRILCDDFTWIDSQIALAGRVVPMVLFAGDRVRISGIKITEPYVSANGGGGLRCIGGNDIIVSDCHVESDDDCFQFVPGADVNLNGNLSITNAHYVNCTGISTRGRLFVATLGTASGESVSTASITDFSFSSISGVAPVTGTAAGAAIQNITSSGAITRGAIIGCQVDPSSSTAARGMDILNQGTGSVTNIDLFGLSIINPPARAIEFRVNGGSVLPTNIRMFGGHLGSPQTSDPTLVVREASKLTFDGVHISGCETQDVSVASIGGSTTDCPNIYFVNCLVDEVGATGAARYGFAWARCSAGGSKNCVVLPASGVTGARGHSLTANSSNLVFDTDDLSALTATAANRILVGSATNIIARNVKGYVTQAHGTDSIASGTTSKTVSHTLNVTPTLGQFSFVFGENPTNDITKNPWIDTITSTQFNLNVAADPGASNLDFGWQINAQKLA